MTPRRLCRLRRSSADRAPVGRRSSADRAPIAPIAPYRCGFALYRCGFALYRCDFALYRCGFALYRCGLALLSLRSRALSLWFSALSRRSGVNSRPIGARSLPFHVDRGANSRRAGRCDLAPDRCGRCGRCGRRGRCPPICPRRRFGFSVITFVPRYLHAGDRVIVLCLIHTKPPPAGFGGPIAPYHAPPHLGPLPLGR